MEEKIEEKKTEENKPETPKDDTDEGVQPDTTSELDRADQIAERQKRENDRREELLKREDALEARKTVGGKSAEQPAKEETEDEKWAKDAKKRYEGTGMDPTPDDTPTEFK